VAASRSRRRLRRALVVSGAFVAVLALAGTAAAAVPITTVAEDPYTNTNAWHQALVEPDTYSFGSTIVGTFQGGGRFSDGGSDNIGWATSTNNGLTWTSGELPGTTQYSNPPGIWNRISDPSVAYDPKHNVWIIAGLAIDFSVVGKAVLASRSFDGGLTWQNPVTISQGGGGAFYDKSWIGCDTSPSSQFYGNCYVEWDDAFAGDKFMMSRSTDGGATWTASSVPNRSVIGGQIVVQPNGTVVVVIAGNGAESYVSTNGGVSYSGPFTISSMTVHGATNMRDGSGLPTAEIDGGGTVYAAWTDCRFRTSCQADDIVYSTSTDGQTWSQVKKVPLVGTNSQLEVFLVGIGVDHATQGASAHIGATFYFMPTNSCNTNTCKVNAAFISSTNAGSTWSTPVKMFGPMKQTSMPNPGGYFLGDYISTSFGSNGKAYPVIANAKDTGVTCSIGNITSCNEDMVAPTNGLAATGGTIPAGTKVVARTGPNPRPHGRLGTAF
jgi:hypothetical protein